MTPLHSNEDARIQVKSIHTKALAASILFAAMSAPAMASDGTITFTGRVTGQTCTLSGNGGAANFTVPMPTVAAGALNRQGAVAGRTPFNIRLTGCTPNTGNVGVYFEPGATVDNTSGRLVNTAVASAATETTPAVTPATNVQVGLLNDALDNIVLGAAYAAQNSQQVALADGAATLQYYAQYVATGAATAGDVLTTVTYSVVYP
ncbi:fimbrial protein [Cupriavidus pauculus]|uniref:Type 1 fimbrial protein n=1 Tax=Cupriavidus pauculus TaxID=82633 RepID=A0A3G8GYL7_9BURK|nr:type 1 fimbrial protein [Cupriavidus pauculus]